MQHSQLLRRCLLPASLHILRIARRRCLLPLVALLVLLFSSSALAQLIPDRQWVVFRQQDGLPSNDVYAVFADGATIWFGTAAGISSYDGRWHAYSTAVSGGHDPVEPIPLGKVVDFATSNTEGAIWAATDSGLVIRWDGQRWTKYTQINTRVHALAEVAGTLWVATERGMLIIASDNVVRAVPLLGNAAVYDLAVVDDGVWLGSERGLWWLSADGEHGRHAVVVNESGAVIDGVVRSVWEAEPGRLWLGMGGMIVDYMPDAGTAQIYQPFMSELSGLSVTAITGIPNDSIWVGASNGGAVQFMLSGRDIVSARNWGSAAQGGLTTNNVRDVVVDQDGSVWFATSVGVFRYQPWAWLGIEDRLDAPPVNDVLLDRIGGLWIATAGEGVQYRAELHSRPILYYPEPAGLPSEFVNALAEDATGQIWAATREGLARFSDRQWHSLAMESALLAEPMRDIEVDDLGLWVGTAKGVLRYDFADGRVAVEPITDGRAIIALAYDSTGRLWVAAANGELWLRAVTGSWYDLTASEGRPGNAPVTALYPDLRQPGHMLLALQGYGVYRSDGEAFEFVENSYRLAGDRIFALLLDGKDGSIWVGSETGLSRLDNISWSTFDAQDGLQNGAVRTILADPDGSYWFGGEKGISRYSPEHSPPWIKMLEVSSLGASPRSDSWQVRANTPAIFNFSYGDLQTQPNKLSVLYRVGQDGQVTPWREAPNGPLEYEFGQIGEYTIEFMVRDQAFNYSQPATQLITVVPKPASINLPLLGEVEVRIFQLLVLFGSLAFFGFGYVSYEIILHRRRVSDAIQRGYNPYISGEPVRKEDMFFGRQDLLQRIVSTLHNNSIMIHGERRIGKTTLLYQLGNALRQVRDAEYWFVPVFIDLEGTSESRLFHLMMEEIAHTVSEMEALDESAHARLESLHCSSLQDREYTDREFSRDLRTVIQVLEAHGAEYIGDRQLRLILLMDEMDTLSQFNHIYQQQLRRIFMRDFAATVGAVVAGIEISKEWDRIESPWFNLFNEIAMQPFTRQDAVDLIVEPVRGYYMYEPDALEFILDNSDGRPYRLQQYALEAVTHMLKEKRRRITMVDVLAAHAQIQETFQETASSTATSGPAAEMHNITADLNVA